jgi:biopolymer transport protein ExbB/TolQ
MLATSLIDLHTEGGIVFMVPLSLMLILILCLTLYSVFSVVQKNVLMPKHVEAIKQIGILAAVFGILSTIIGLFQAFDVLGSSKQTWPFQVIMGGMKVAIITAMYGLFILCLSMIAYIILKLSTRNSV